MSTFVTAKDLIFLAKAEGFLWCSRYIMERNLSAPAVKDADSTLKQDRAIGRNVLGAIVERYLTQAQATIRSVERGEFPVLR
jgi:hypothetical protein